MDRRHRNAVRNRQQEFVNAMMRLAEAEAVKLPLTVSMPLPPPAAPMYMPGVELHNVRLNHHNQGESRDPEQAED